MRGRYEARFERRRGEVDAVLKHRVKKPVECRHVALHHFGIGARRLRAKVETEHATDGLRAKDRAMRARRSIQPVGQRARGLLELRVKTGRRKELERREAGGCLLYTSPSPRDGLLSRMPSSA